MKTVASHPTLLTSENWLAVWLGVLTIVLVILGFQPASPLLKWAMGSELVQAVLAPGNLWDLSQLGMVCVGLAGLGVGLMGGRVIRYLGGTLLVVALAMLAQVLAGYAGFHRWGLEYVIFALVIGLLVGNALRLPAWFKEAARTEYYIKVGLVIFGANILSQDILQAGALGIVQALLVVMAVWSVGFWVARWLKVDDEFAVMLATAVSICGVSAVIAAWGAIQGDKKKLSYVTPLVLVCAVPMMIVMPWLARLMHLPDPVAGAWMGGVIDTNGAMVAAGALVSESAMKASVIVKFSQNVLIGLAAFILSLWWTLRSGSRTGQRPSARMI